ncbi:MAG: L-lactate permease [Neisseria sp.]|uniref:L-lactate permease n=1 Tax=Neisseria sp. TaxID=192066 RepID=UPI0026DA78D7|nr:L-lactate permease [Neisseria sp.]MDO4641950.1 L-lactate permease [Neisseria sp.]
MLSSIANPLGNIWYSAAVAAVPIILFLLSLTVLKMKGIHAALLTLIVTLVLSFFPFNLPANVAVAAVVQGVVQGMWPIGYIIIMAVWLYKLTVASGKFDVIKGSLAMVSPDQRIQLLLIAFCFGAFLEGAAGFGVPIAICGVMLAALGFNPLQAAMLCLIANAASGAFGAIGIPVAIIDTFHLEGVTAMDVSKATNTTLPFIAASIPFLLVWIIDGFKGIKETLPALLVTSGVFTASQMAVTYFLGPELADILPPLLSLVALAALSTRWQPKNVFRIVPEDKEEATRHSGGEILSAWAPFYILSAFVIVWSLPLFKSLFKADAVLSFTNLSWVLAETGGKKIGVDIAVINSTGTAILFAVIATILISGKSLGLSRAVADLRKTCKELWLSIATISFILAIAKLTTYSGMTQALGEAVSVTGSIFPLLSPVLGWIGVFMTGSVVNNNTLFAPVQSIVAHRLQIDSALLVQANTAGGTMAKLVSPQSIAIATAAVGKSGQESTLLKMTLKYSFSLLVFVCIWTFILAKLS